MADDTKSKMNVNLFVKLINDNILPQLNPEEQKELKRTLLQLNKNLSVDVNLINGTLLGGADANTAPIETEGKKLKAMIDGIDARVPEDKKSDAFKGAINELGNLGTDIHDKVYAIASTYSKTANAKEVGFEALRSRLDTVADGVIKEINKLESTSKPASKQVIDVPVKTPAKPQDIKVETSTAAKVDKVPPATDTTKTPTPAATPKKPGITAIEKDLTEEEKKEIAAAAETAKKEKKKKEEGEKPGGIMGMIKGWIDEIKETFSFIIGLISSFAGKIKEWTGIDVKPYVEQAQSTIDGAEKWVAETATGLVQSAGLGGNEPAADTAKIKALADTHKAAGTNTNTPSSIDPKTSLVPANNRTASK